MIVADMLPIGGAHSVVGQGMPGALQAHRLAREEQGQARDGLATSPTQDGESPAFVGAMAERSPNAVDSRWYVPCMVLLLVLAAFLRFHRLDYQSLFRDEGHTLLLARADWHTILRLGDNDPHPAFYFVCVRLWSSLLGWSLSGLRSFSAVCGIGVVAGTVLLAYQLRGRLAALYVSLLAVPSAYLIGVSQEARAYTLFPLLVLCAILSANAALKKPSPGRWLLTWVATVLALYTDHLGPPLAILALPFVGRRIAGVLLLAVAAWVPGAAQLWMLHAHSTYEHLAIDRTLALFFTLPGGMLTGAGSGSLARMLVDAVAITTAAALILRASRQTLGLSAAFLVVLTVAIGLHYRVGVDASAQSRGGMLAPFLLLLLGVAAAEQPFRRIWPLLALLVAFGSGDIARGFYSRPRNGGWKQFAEWLRATGETRPVFAIDGYRSVLLGYYYPGARPLGSTRPVGAFLVAADNDAFIRERRFPIQRVRRFVNVLVAEAPGGPAADCGHDVRPVHTGQNTSLPAHTQGKSGGRSYGPPPVMHQGADKKQ